MQILNDREVLLRAPSRKQETLLSRHPNIIQRTDAPPRRAPTSTVNTTTPPKSTAEPTSARDVGTQDAGEGQPYTSTSTENEEGPPERPAAERSVPSAQNGGALSAQEAGEGQPYTRPGGAHGLVFCWHSTAWSEGAFLAPAKSAVSKPTTEPHTAPVRSASCGVASHRGG